MNRFKTSLVTLSITPLLALLLLGTTGCSPDRTESQPRVVIQQSRVEKVAFEPQLMKIVQAKPLATPGAIADPGGDEPGESASDPLEKLQACDYLAETAQKTIGSDSEFKIF